MSLALARPGSMALRSVGNLRAASEAARAVNTGWRHCTNQGPRSTRNIRSTVRGLAPQHGALLESVARRGGDSSTPSHGVRTPQVRDCEHSTRAPGRVPDAQVPSVDAAVWRSRTPSLPCAAVSFLVPVSDTASRAQG